MNKCNQGIKPTKQLTIKVTVALFKPEIRLGAKYPCSECMSQSDELENSSHTQLCALVNLVSVGSLITFNNVAATLKMTKGRMWECYHYTGCPKKSVTLDFCYFDIRKYIYSIFWFHQIKHCLLKRMIPRPFEIGWVFFILWLILET